MAVYNWPTSATLQGAIELNRVHLKAKQEDLGSKIEKLISAVSEMQSAVSTLNTVVSAINLACVSAADSGVSFSAFSTTPSSTITLTVATFSNFRASHPA